MRILLLALMIALLPLRVWVGDAMAVEQLVSALDNVHVTAPATHERHHEAQPCHEHAGEVHLATLDANDKGQATGDCAGCTVCQICHSVALTSVLPGLAAAALPTAVPHTLAVLHASAERAPGFKPPIS